MPKLKPSLKNLKNTGLLTIATTLLGSVIVSLQSQDYQAALIAGTVGVLVLLAYEML